MNGKVYLVGAGPGDPELLTLKALKVLGQADVVLYDELVSNEILELIPPQVRRQSVGKRAGREGISQTEINAVLVKEAGLGLTVVRLKGGDPLIFGRAGEELEALRRSGIEVEIVPGVTSALGAAAAAQIPLTHRHFASAVTLLAGQSAADAAPADWRPFVQSGATLVLYMPGSDYATIAAKLRAAGIEDDLPCAVIARATTAEQQIHATTVAGLAYTAPLPSPALLVVGAVAQFVATQPARAFLADTLVACRTAN
jgi:uroporphyrin-III C-methyltransferase